MTTDQNAMPTTTEQWAQKFTEVFFETVVVWAMENGFKSGDVPESVGAPLQHLIVCLQAQAAEAALKKPVKAMPDRNAVTKQLLQLPDDDHRAHYDFIKQHQHTLAAALDDTIHIQFADNGFVRQWQELPFDGSEAFDTSKLVMRLGTYKHQAQERCDMLETVQSGLRLLQEKFPCVETNHVDYRCEAYRIACEMLNDISKVLPLPLFDNLPKGDR